ncbi:MAG TPA: YlbF family regulator [Gemmatimonadaceae bacterium]|nr:YlbF family regulator [Gemmatimonadaceae bacterium]
MLDQKAKELGRMIGQSSEYQGVKRANDALHNERDAVTALNRMEALRREAQMLLTQGKEPTDEMERELDDLLGKVQSNPAYQKAIVAQENFDKLMIQVNGWISEGIKAGAASPIITLG